MTTDSPTMDDSIFTPDEIKQNIIVRRPGMWDIRVTAVIHQTVYFEYVNFEDKRTVPGTVMTRQEFFTYFNTGDVLWLRKQEV